MKIPKYDIRHQIRSFTTELNTEDAGVNQHVSGASQQVSGQTLGTTMPAQAPKVCMLVTGIRLWGYQPFG